MFSDHVLVAGNGESRKCFDLNSSKVDVVGCNALHRDFIPKHLVCCDQRMVKEALENPKSSEFIIHTRDRYYVDFRKIQKNKNVMRLPELPYSSNARSDQPIHWGSGPYAVLLACSLGYKNINLVGFDLYGIDNRINNVYKGTRNYGASKAPAIDPNYWIYQIGKVFECFPDRTFNVYNTSSWTAPKNWLKNNVNILFMDSVDLDIINTFPIQYTEVV